MARFRMGTAFLGRYVLLGPVGHGAISEVYQAFDTVAGRRRAIKILVGPTATHEHTRAALRREAILTDRVRHPSVARVFEHGGTGTPDGATPPHLVLELLCGDVLADRLRAGPLPWPEALAAAAAIADVLAVAHRRAVVHRDLTPANVMLTRDGAKVLDFGLAVTVPRPPDDGPYFLTPAEPPNDFPGPGDPADDVFALGALLYQMLTGEPPPRTPPGGARPGGARGAPAAVRAQAALRFPVPAPVLRVPGLPRDVADLCRRCLARSPADRPDAVSVALDLWSMIVAEQAPVGAAADISRASRER